MDDIQERRAGLLNVRFLTLVGITLAAAASRLLPHPPNFTPIGAMALFGGAHFASAAAAFAVPLAAMLLSDLVLAATMYGFAVFPGMPFVYGSFAASVCLGRCLRHRRSPFAVGAAALTGSVLFFVVTNFGVWLGGNLYPLTVEGLAACYIAAIPFFQNTLAGDAFYTVVLFGGFVLAQRYFVALREGPATVSPHG